MAVIIKMSSCPYCNDKKYRNIAKHIKKEHKVSFKVFFEDLCRSGVLHQELCSNCHLKIDLERLKKITFGQIVFYSYKNKITCSAHCSKSLSRSETIKTYPEYRNQFLSVNEKRKGKTFEENYGKQQSDLIKEKLSLKTSGQNNPNFGGKYCRFDGVKKYARLNFEQRYGHKKAVEVKNKISKKTSGKNNPMYGKPAPNGSGNGWKGWYKGLFFRSLLELSFLIENKDKQVESAEKNKFKISYQDYDGKLRSYFPDFRIAQSLFECKPKTLWNTQTNKLRLQENIVIKII